MGKIAKLWLVCAAAVLLAAGCDDETEQSVDDSPCGQLAVTLCEASCACADDCRIRFPSGGTQGFGNEIQSSWDQCTNAYTNSCKAESVDVSACEAALATAQCTTPPDSPARQLPDECTP